MANVSPPLCNQGLSRWRQHGLLAGVCASVIAVYIGIAREGAETQPSLNPAGSYYNLLVQGFRAGQLNLKKEVPARLAEMADPYTPSPMRPVGVMDLSYYKGKLYLYFGVTPAVLLFWPYVALTGQYLSTKASVLSFCGAGFLASVGLLCSLWRRCFAGVSVWVVAAGTLALGLATFIAPLVARCDVWEVAVGCAYMLTMLSLVAIWKSFQAEQRPAGWLAAASVAYGLAVGARPNVALGAVVLLLPVARAWRERRPVGRLLAAAIVPISIIGAGLAVYNFRRFDDPLEFGIRYAVTVRSQLHMRLFDGRHFWPNLRMYFIEPARWSTQLPFVHRIGATSSPTTDGFGLLSCVPLVWLALAAPLAWRGRAESSAPLRWFVAAAALLFAVNALTLCFYYIASLRYQVDFVPTLVLVAVIGVFGLEQALAEQRARLRLARWGWGLLLAFSVAFNLLACAQRCAEADNDLGLQRQADGRLPEAIRLYRRALRLYPELADAHINLGNALVQSSRLEEAIAHYEQGLRLKPDSAKGQNDFAIVLARRGRLPEAVERFERALQLEPDFAEAHNNLGAVLMATGRLAEAVEHWQQALRINPGLADPHNNLGVALKRMGRLPEAIEHWQQALRINPALAEAHYNLAVAFKETGRRREAIEQFEQALRVKPDYVEAQQELDRLRAGR